MVLGPQFNFRGIAQPFGTKPIPEGHVRVNHYTSPEGAEGIKREGLSMARAHESFARGGTEFPSIFMNAGAPSETLLRARPVVEAHVPTSQLDIGSHRSPRELEAHQSTVTTNVDVPRENILAVHEPWHQTFRYIMEDPQTRQGVMRGDYENIDEDTDKAVQHSKIVMAGRAMLGIPSNR